MPTRTQRVVAQIFTRPMLAQDQLLVAILSARAKTRYLVGMALSESSAQLVSAQVGPTQQCLVGNTVWRPPLTERPRHTRQHMEPHARNTLNRAAMIASI